MIRVYGSVTSVGLTGWPGISCPHLAYECTVSGILWPDLNAAEASHPGQFRGKPFTVRVWGRDFGPQGCDLIRGLTSAVEQVTKVTAKK